MLHRYRQEPNVLYAEPNWKRILYGGPDERQSLARAKKPNDPDYRFLWGLKNRGRQEAVRGADIDAERAWGITTGSRDVVVGVIDTGIDYSHPDLEANMHRNECDDNGVDDDGNGYVDDCYGIASIFGNVNTDPIDTFGHGTHVAGTIGAVGNNNIGVVGVNWETSLVACDFFTAADAVTCLEYVSNLKDMGADVVATNNSWGFPFFSQALYDAIETHMDRGILFVAAAGNFAYNNDYTPDTPSGYNLPNVIAVASSDNRDWMSNFTQWGSNSVHVSAPGTDVLSTLPKSFGSYGYYSGTSMSSPHVAGLAALIKAKNPDATWYEIRNLILAGAEDEPNLRLTVTGGRINAFNSLKCKRRTGKVRARLRPSRDGLTATLNEGGLFVSMLSIVCSEPADGDSIDIRVRSADNTHVAALSLKDDGTGGDMASGDGIYSTIWRPGLVGNYSLEYGDGMVTQVSALHAYRVEKTIFQWRDIDGLSLDLSDESTARIAPPFPIRLGVGGVDSSHLFVESNGTIGTEPAGSFLFFTEPLPARSIRTPVIAPRWWDLYPLRGTDSNVFVGTLGTAPRREFVVEWRNVKPYDCQTAKSLGNTFQVVFFEDSSDVVFNYANKPRVCRSIYVDPDATGYTGIQTSSSAAEMYEAPIRAKTALRWHQASER